MILSARLLWFAVHGIKRQQDAEALGSDADTSAPILLKALAVAGAGALVYETAKDLLQPFADWVGESFPDVAESPLLKPILKAVGMKSSEPIGQVPEASDVAKTERAADLEGFEAQEKESEAEKKLAPPSAAEGAPKAPTPTTPYVARKIGVLKGEHPGVSKISFLSDAERLSFQSLRAQQETFRGGRGITESTKSLVKKAAAKYELPEDWIMSMVQFESGGNPNAVSTEGAVGLMQFIGPTGRQMGMKNRFDPAENIDAGARLMLANIKSLQAENRRLSKAGKKEIPIDLTNVYLAHQMGDGGAIQIHNAAYNGGTVSAKTQKNMGLNLGVKSAEDYIAANAAKMEKAQVASKATSVAAYNQPNAASPASSTAPAVQQPKVIAKAPVPPAPAAGFQSILSPSSPHAAATRNLPPRETFLVNNVPVYIK